MDDDDVTSPSARRKGVSWEVLNTFELPRNLEHLYQNLQQRYVRDHGEETPAVADAREKFYQACTEAIAAAQDVDLHTHKISIVYRPARVDFAVSEIKNAKKTFTAQKRFSLFDRGKDEEAAPQEISTIPKRRR